MKKLGRGGGGLDWAYVEPTEIDAMDRFIRSKRSDRAVLNSIRDALQLELDRNHANN